MKPRGGQRLVEGWTVGVLATLGFSVLVDDLPIAAVEIGFDGFPLGIEAETALAHRPVETRQYATNFPSFCAMAASRIVLLTAGTKKAHRAVPGGGAVGQ